MEYIREHLVIEGRVQGVWFRESTRKKAVGLGVTGWVKNLPEGGVEAVVEGPKPQVLRLVQWCHEGPSAARVTRVRETQEPYQNDFHTFKVRLYERSEI